MRTIAIFLGLFLLFLAGGQRYKLKPGPVTRHGDATEAPALSALAKKLRAATALRESGHYSEATDLFQAGYREARLRKDAHYEARFLLGIANCHFAQRHYQEALQEFLSAREALPSSEYRTSRTYINGSLASIYSQVGEYDAAIDAAKRGLAEVPADARDSTRARLTILLATLYAKQGQADAAREMFQQGIREAGEFGNPDLLSNGWDRLGCEFLLQKKLPQAEDALLEGYRIRKLNHLPSLGVSYRNLGMLRIEQGDLRSASTLLDASVQESKSGRGRIPEWRFYQARGQLRLAQGRVREGYADFRVALDLARDYRLFAPPSDATRVGMEGLLQEVYASFVETGSQLYFESPRADLARETFEAVEENRAGSLVARLDERKQLRRNLPPAYWEQLGQLESAESAALLGGGEGARQNMRRLRASLIELEAKAGGAGFTLRPDLLESTQRSLDASSVFLSFHLAARASYLWAVSASGVSLYRLPDRASIARQAGQFRRAILTGSAGAEPLGRELYRMLFGALGPEHLEKSRWLLSLDEELFDLPFAALAAGGRPGAPVYLIERHSLRIVSGAALRAAQSAGTSRIAGGFVGVGDAIYNMADPRWRGRLPDETRPWFLKRLGFSWRASAAPPVSLGLNRLPGSGPEIEACAREWDNEPVLFKGRDATKENIRRALALKPAVVHFATHVVQGQERSSSALIALSVSDKGRDDLLGPAEIGGWNVDAGLVVLSGCSSGAAAVRPGAGLMGLTRAWLMAGTRAVVATEWTTPDDVGVFFRRFYQRLRRSDTHDPAEALRAAQVETLRSHDWRSQPSFWAAYFALGNY